MTRGRKPTPTQLKIVKGTTRKDRMNPREPVVSGNLIGPPEHFCEAQKEIWKYAIENAPSGLLKRLDLSILETWVTAMWIFRDTQRDVQAEGLMTTTINGVPVPNPKIGIMTRQSQLIMKAASEMGFTPSSRSKIVMTEEKIKDDPWSKLANGS
jgi:P27 family predicted phage terminase small subunit